MSITFDPNFSMHKVISFDRFTLKYLAALTILPQIKSHTLGANGWEKQFMTEEHAIELALDFADKIYVELEKRESQ
jgi:hypothetical protein